MTFESSLVVGFFLVWGALPLLGQLIPTLEFSSLSSRNIPDSQTEKLNTQLSLDPSTLGQFFFPRIPLKPGQDMAEALQSDKDGSSFPFAADWGYLGPWVFLLILLGLPPQRKKESLWFWGGFRRLIPCSTAWGRFTPLHRLFSGLLPGLSTIRVPYRFLYLYILAACVLAAFGFEQWWKERTAYLPRTGP